LKFWCWAEIMLACLVREGSKSATAASAQWEATATQQAASNYNLLVARLEAREEQQAHLSRKVTCCFRCWKDHLSHCTDVEGMTYWLMAAD